MRPVRLGGVDYEQIIHDALKTQPVADSVERHPFGVVGIAFSQEESNPLNVRFIVQVLYGPRIDVRNTTLPLSFAKFACPIARDVSSCY